MNKLQQISEYFNKLSEGCGPIPLGQNPQNPQNPQGPSMNRPPMNRPPMNRPPMNRPPMNRPPMSPQTMSQSNPQITPDQLNDPNFIANIVTQVLQLLSNPASEEDFLNEQGDIDNIMRMNPDTNRDSLEKIAKTTDHLQTLASRTQETKVKINILDDETEVTIKTTGKGLDDVTISWDEPWGREEHTVDFEYEDKIEDHGNEGMDLLFTAEVPLGPKSSSSWEFGLEVYAEATYPNTDPVDWDWNTLEINMIKDKKIVTDPDSEIMVDPDLGYAQSHGMTNTMENKTDMEEGTCGYTQTADGKKLNTPGGTRGMSALNRTNFMR